ncbi:uncharacterized protein [Choristoneura fumiferana]|uniref:uncharacterized protein n=1 Tax=Choristoneura fumiferana TaxID=7141 RepID=UPI003D156B04
MSKELLGLIAEQEQAMEIIQKLKINFKKTSKARLTRGYVKARKETLDDYWKNFVETNRSIIKIVNKEDMENLSYFTKDYYSAYEEFYINLKAEMTDLLEDSTQIPSSLNLIQQNKIEEIKLPKINIPQFTGNYQDWTSFHDLFVSLIHNKTNLGNVQKLHYLKSCLSGEPEHLLKHLPVTDSNYDLAWNMLQGRYNNKRIIVNSILSRLINQKKMNAGTAKSIREILDVTMECLNKLKGQGVDTTSWDAIIIHMTVSKLDTETHKEWEEEVSDMNINELPSLSKFERFLEKRFRVLEMMHPIPTTSANIQREPYHAIKSRSFVVAAEMKCGFCKQNHVLFQCKEFQQLTLERKTDFVQNQRLCFNCLMPGHPVKYCNNKSSCHTCGRRHHSLLHRSYTSRQSQERENKEKKPEIENREKYERETKHQLREKEIINHLTTGNITALLSTAQIKVTNEQGKQFVLRALLDPCSQESFITESAAQTMGLKRIHVNGHVSGLSQMRTPINFAADIEISSRYNSKKMKITTYIVKRVTSIMPSEKLTIDNWEHLKDLQLADPTYYQPGPIDILLGVEVYNEFIQPGLIKGIPGSPTALQTYLGWILSGKITVGEEVNKNQPFISMHLNVELNEMLQKFWELETIEEESDKLTAEEKRVEEIYEKTTTRDENGRYIVNLTFRNDPPVLPANSKEIALNRWKTTEKRLTKEPKLMEEYNRVLEEYLTLNHMEKIETKEEKDNLNNVYLSHHAVIKEERETSKVRVVFDASCKGSNGVSLNDELMIGPPVLEELRTVILRWRKHRIAFVADVEKMYRQIKIKKDHTDYQRILWRAKIEGPIEEYRLLTVTFGTSCAPYLAIRTLRQTAIDEGFEYPEAKEAILRDFYMDDLLTGRDTENEAITMQKQITKILNSGGFKLQKWCSNSELFMRQLKENQKIDETQTVEIQKKENVKTLGVTWSVKSDTLSIPNKIRVEEDVIMTKRSILSDIASLFDPMGWIAPSIVLAKIFLQKLWKSGISWDEHVPEELQKEWLQYKRELPALRDITLNRWIHTSHNKSTIELHGFADASASAYAAVIYARVVKENGEIKVSLLSAKTKVAPIKTISLPRLELCAATLLSKHLKQIANILEIDIQRVYAWTDSQVALAWIHGDPMKWTPFVKNRVLEIIEKFDASHWFYINTKHNPADAASRGVMPEKLKSLDIWWNGPDNLKERHVKLEKGKPMDTALEKRKNIVTMLVTDKHKNEEKLTLLQRYSSLDKLVRVVAYCKRWLNIMNEEKRRYLRSYLTHEERNTALITCIRMSQEIEFSEEIEDLQNDRQLKAKSRLLSLSAFLDEDRVLRVGGRLKHADIEFIRKHPIIISKDNVLLPLLLREAHAKTLHGPPQMMITYLRSKYWLINAGNSVKRFVRTCVVCLKQNAKNREQKMGDLPAIRVKPSRPFLISGVDFAGPINVKMSKGRGAKSNKAYICLFICMCTKALHIELVSDMTTQTFLAAFRRFVSRRGHVAEMWSDHGTTFVSAEKELLNMWKQGIANIPDEFSSMLDKEGTKWKFIPPGAPNFGGLWEAGVKSTKYHLKRIVGESTLTFEELSTVLIQIEACLNSRPLSPISDHKEDLEPLTPGHLLIGEPLVVLPSPDLKDLKINTLDRWQLTTRIVQDFWKRWQSEYLSRMQERSKWRQSMKEFEVGDLVIIKDQRYPPGHWLMGRIVKKYPGHDNITRTYDIRTISGILRRAITKLCPLLSEINKNTVH